MVEIDGRAIVALSVPSIDRARDLCTQSWSTEQLASYRIGGLALRALAGMAWQVYRCTSVQQQGALRWV